MATGSFILLQVPMTNVKQVSVCENNKGLFLIVYMFFLVSIDYFSLGFQSEVCIGSNCNSGSFGD